MRTLKINEWLASILSSSDFIEVYNPDSAPVALAGFSWSDDPSLTSKMRFQVGPLSFVGARRWVAWKADESTEMGDDHLNFRLDRLGEALRLYAPNGDLIDAIDFGLQQSGFSEGRFIDGGPEIGLLTNGPSPGRSNVPTLVNPDADGDGLPNDWETAHGTNPEQADANTDLDQDGMSNAEEYAAGTHPADQTSRLEIGSVSWAQGQIELQFLAVSNRTYRVLFRTELSSDIWNTLIEVPANITNRWHTVTDDSKNGQTKTRFYRLALPTPSLR
jgi:hypothetical protein